MVYHESVYHKSVATALVLSAGGLFAAWEAGVWKALAPRFRPDIVVGASAGAWNAWAIAGGASGEDLCRIWRDPQIGKIMQFGPHRAGLLRPGALYASARQMFESFQPRCPFACTLVELPSLRLRLFRGPEITWRHLAATCAIPFGFPPVEIDGRRYVDGGLRGALPLWAAGGDGRHPRHRGQLPDLARPLSAAAPAAAGSGAPAPICRSSASSPRGIWGRCATP